MSYNNTNHDTGEAIYRDWVRRRLVRSHEGLSVRGCIGVLLIVVFSIMLFTLPATEHSDGMILEGVTTLNFDCPEGGDSC